MRATQKRVRMPRQTRRRSLTIHCRVSPNTQVNKQPDRRWFYIACTVLHMVK